MNAIFNDDHLNLSHALDQVISQHGRLRVAGALLLRLLRRDGPRVAALPFNDHLRRDIGLQPMDHRIDLPPQFAGPIR